MIPRIDGDFSDWGMVPETYSIGLDQLMDTKYGKGTNLDPKDYLRSQLMLGSGFNVQLGYLFKSLISADVRFTHLESDEFSFLNNGTFYNRPNYYTFGLSKYFVRNYGFKIQAAITYVEVSEGSTYSQQTGVLEEPYNAIELKGNEIIIRLITSFNF